jgi:DNA-binding NtrC family response regulator
MLSRVLLAIGPAPLRRRLNAVLARPGILVKTPRITKTTWPSIARESADLLLVSLTRIPRPHRDSIELLRKAPEAPDIVVFAEGDDPELHAALLSAGCEAVLSSRIPTEALGDLLRSVLDRRRARLSRMMEQRPAQGPPRLADFVSDSVAMQAFMSVVQRVVDTDTTLLVLGETGVGKERLARAIHSEGPRATGPFVAVNCGALPEGLLESEIFGHEQGAFTGATRSRRGHFELAHGGTLFLDEVGEMPLHLQVKLLRVLQDHEFQPIGGERPIRVDVRVMAASNRDLEAAAEEGTFRKDLFYRLGVVSLTLPALRERREDIPSLAASYIDHYRALIGNEVAAIRPEALRALVAHRWPGNVRELMNVVERAVLLTEDHEIRLEHLPAVIAGAETRDPTSRVEAAAARFPPGFEERPWRALREELLTDLEREYLVAQLTFTRGRIGETARRSGMTTRSLHEKMARLGLRKEDFR